MVLRTIAFDFHLWKTILQYLPWTPPLFSKSSCPAFRHFGLGLKFNLFHNAFWLNPRSGDTSYQNDNPRAGGKKNIHLILILLDPANFILWKMHSILRYFFLLKFNLIKKQATNQTFFLWCLAKHFNVYCINL